MYDKDDREVEPVESREVNSRPDSTELLLITEELAKELRSPHSTPSVIQALLMQFGEEIKRGAIEP